MQSIPPIPRHLDGHVMLRLSINLKLYRDGYMTQYTETITVPVSKCWEDTCYTVEREVAMACDDWGPRYRAYLGSFGGWSKA